ncbi:MAG: hypothetical protein FJ216_08335 [Ignavibacteria bacterium]|nr:hypothetical protein [Ignavibacteria bacterium]
MLSRKDIKKVKKVFWDYKVNLNPLFEYLKDTKNYNHKVERILIRMFERLFWYDLISILGIENIRKIITKDFISKIRFTDLQEKYEFARKLLQKETLPASGWNSENREKFKTTVLSNRWYCFK